MNKPIGLPCKECGTPLDPVPDLWGVWVCNHFGCERYGYRFAHKPQRASTFVKRTWGHRKPKTTQ